MHASKNLNAKRRNAQRKNVRAPRQTDPRPGRGRTISFTELAVAATRPSVSSMLGMLLSIGLCAASIVIGWGLLLASLLYVVSDYSTATWLLTALGLAVAHAVFAATCWRYAVLRYRDIEDA